MRGSLVAGLSMAAAFAAPQARPFTAPLPTPAPVDRARSGSAVAVGQRVAVVGAPGDSVRGPDAGSVQVYDRDAQSGAYTLVQTLMPPGLSPFDRFGASVSLSGNVLVVGAKGDDDAAPNAGAAYVYQRAGAGQPFALVDKLTPPSGGISDCYGIAVNVLGNRIAVGASRSDLAAFDGGAAYVYAFDFAAGTVTLDAVVTHQGAQPGDSFGSSVAVFADQLLVGATRLDSPQGPQNVGGVVAFERDPAGTWNEIQRLFQGQPGAQSRFGCALAFEPPRPGVTGTLVVGASDAATPGSVVPRGSVTVFERAVTNPWQEVFAHGPGGVPVESRLGSTLVLQGGTFLAGAPGRERDTGAVDAFVRVGGVWQAAGQIVIPGSARGDVVGAGVGFANQFPVIGAPGREAGGVDSAGWVWSSSQLWAPIGSAYCAPAVPNSTGNAAALSARGSLTPLDQNFTLEAGFVPPGTFGFALISRAAAVTPNPGGSSGNLCLGGSIGRFDRNIAQADPGGRMGITLDLLDLPSPLAPAVLIGDQWWFQIWFRDSDPLPTSNFTNAIGVTFG